MPATLFWHRPLTKILQAADYHPLLFSIILIITFPGRFNTVFAPLLAQLLRSSVLSLTGFSCLACFSANFEFMSYMSTCPSWLHDQNSTMRVKFQWTSVFIQHLWSQFLTLKNEPTQVLTQVKILRYIGLNRNATTIKIQSVAI